jgi:hypothetical protein
LVPGVYSLDDFPEEAKLPGVRLKITDQINRKEVLEADYFAGYGTLNEGKDDFDVIAVCESKYDFEDPHRIKYRKKPRFVGNYRRGYSDAITWGAGIEAYEKSVILDSVAIFVTEFGTFAPNLSYSYAKWGDDKKSHSAGAGFYYKLPENPYGIFFETFLGLKAKGFSDLGKGEDDAETYNKFIERYFTDAGLKDKFKCTSSESSSSRQIIARVYTKPLFGCITPAFIFGGLWSKNQRFREYTLSLVCRIFDYCSMVVSGGLSYDDPFRGVNQKAPDRRLTVACTIPIGTDFSLAGTYYHHEDDRLRSSASIAYTPVALEGLEIKAERSWLPGFNNNSAYVKYDGSYFNIKVEEKIENQFEHDGKSASHRNRQRVFFGSSLTTDGIKSARKVNINVLRTAEESMK